MQRLFEKEQVIWLKRFHNVQCCSVIPCMGNTVAHVSIQHDFDIFAERKYSIRVHRPYHVGLGDIVIRVTDRKLEGNVLEIEQIIVNNTSPLETLQFRCSLFIPSMKRMQRFITELKNGQDRKLYYLPNADRLKGKELWIRAEQVNGRRILNYRWTVGESWEAQEPVTQKAHKRQTTQVR